jgi:hypothetical protein
MKIEQAVGTRRFTESELLEIRLQLYDRELEFREYAVRYARCLKHFVALPNPNLRSIAQTAIGLATAELRINEPQTVCEIPPGEHLGARGFVKITAGDNRIFIRLHDDVCPCVVAITALHECRHRWQVINKRFIEMYGPEPDAERFAASIMRKYHFACGACGKTY